MNVRSTSRPASVWVALSLQSVVTAISVYASVAVLLSWSRFPASVHTQLLVRDFIPAAIAFFSIIGLFQRGRWGWLLACIADALICVQFLAFILQAPAALKLPLRFLWFNIWEPAALVALLAHPVREHFWERHSENDRKSSPLFQAGAVSRSLRVLAYFLVAVLATCAATAFSLAIFMGAKNGGVVGFEVFLMYGAIFGSGAAFLFALLLTAAARKCGPKQLWPWLLLGGLLAPALIVILALAGILVGNGLWGYLFGGPTTLFQVWWLTPPAGVVTGWICYLMYPWAYPPLRSAAKHA